jgi:hypothetical protein
LKRINVCNAKSSIENQLKSTENWYTSWFDSPYYHILYIEIIEAQVFMDNLTHYLQEKQSAGFSL